MTEISLNIEGHVTPVLIGRNLMEKLQDITRQRPILIVDDNVYKLHTIKFNGFSCITVPAGEKQKTLSFAEDVMRQMIRLEADRDAFLVGVGGGLVTDLAGFVASVYMRGIKFGFVSTTLLGQVDASIGGKNGVNLDGYKNMIGAFRQPEFVLCDLELLNTLDTKEMTSGFAEVIKYGAIRDSDLFSYIENHLEEILHRNPTALEKIVTVSARIKAGIVQSDPTETGERKLLNFGHTFGHAIEKLTGLLHGEAIAIGMVLAARLSVKMGFLDKNESFRLEQAIHAAGLPDKTDVPPAELFDALLKDKKRSGGHIFMVLLKRIGDAFIHKMDLNSVQTAVHDLY
jgi:3-dehydroquinate synthase